MTHDPEHELPAPPGVAARALRALRERESAAAVLNEVGALVQTIARSVGSIVFGKRNP